MQIDRLLEGVDLSAVHTILTLAGMFLAVYLMQLTSHADEDHDDPPALKWCRRAALAAIALALLWSLSYSQTKSWQPWPPEIALIFAIIAMMGVRAVAIHARMRRQGSFYRVPPRPAPLVAKRQRN